MSADSILDRLEGVRSTGAGRWVARCPAHPDKNPSFAVWETDDQRTMVYCRAGCETRDVLAALGLDWSALYPPRQRTEPPQRRRRHPLVHPADALRLIYSEALIVGIVAGDLARGVPLSEDDHQRLLEAVGRIARAVDGANV